MLSIRLRELRNELNLTQEEIAIKLSTSRQAYANWETNRGEPNIDMLLKLASLFGVSIDYLCGNTDVRDSIYKDPELCRYINKCIAIYDDFFKARDK